MPSRLPVPYILLHSLKSCADYERCSLCAALVCVVLQHEFTMLSNKHFLCERYIYKSFKSSRKILNALVRSVFDGPSDNVLHSGHQNAMFLQPEQQNKSLQLLNQYLLPRSGHPAAWVHISRASKNYTLREISNILLSESCGQPHFRALDFGFWFNQPIVGVRWPASLRRLYIFGEFIQPIFGLDWPGSLPQITLGLVEIGKFNQPIAGVVGPASLQRLNFGTSFK